MATLGDRVREEREARGWSLQRLASETSKIAQEKCPRVTIEKIESRGSGYSKWGRPIALALGVNPHWLATGEGPKTLGRSIDRKLQLLPPADYDELYNQFDTLIEERLIRKRTGT
jgi:transcriptional regulator with XRE-family HTH domain